MMRDHVGERLGHMRDYVYSVLGDLLRKLLDSVISRLRILYGKIEILKSIGLKTSSYNCNLNNKAYSVD